MTKRKLTKHEDDIRRGLRPIDRYEPRARSIGGAWRMVKCIDGAYVDAEQHDEVVEYLRKNADISPPQSPHDTIEEQNQQIEALKRDVLEKTAENARLKAEVERLTKAGDAMAEEIALAKRQDEGSRFDPIEMHYDHELIVKWNAAKEGKQS